MNLINKAREGKMIVVSTLQVQYYRSENIVLQIFLKQKTKMLKQSQRKAIYFGKHEVGWGRGGKIPSPKPTGFEDSKWHFCLREIISLFQDNRWEMSHSQIRGRSHQWE